MQKSVCSLYHSYALQGKARVEKSVNSTGVLWVCKQHGSLPCLLSDLLYFPNVGNRFDAYETLKTPNLTISAFLHELHSVL